MEKIKGFPDIFGQNAWKFNYISNKLIDIGARMCCELVILPIMESLELFKRSIGADTDIVNKEMFIFDNEWVLRPEMTASLVRSLKDRGKFTGRYMYYGNCFRKERPQKGRYRQFTQFGIEFIGSGSITEEMNLLLFLNNMINSLSLKGLVVKINSIGSLSQRLEFHGVLKGFLEKNYERLSAEAKEKFKKGSLFRILDSKDDSELLKDAPTILDHLDCKPLEDLKAFCDYIGLNAKIDPTIVRGLDYYNDFVFEITPENPHSSQSSLGGGGRYDCLFSHLGFQNTPAIGLAIGVERLIEYMDDNQIAMQIKEKMKVGYSYDQNIFNVINSYQDILDLCLLDLEHKKALKRAEKMALNLAIIPHDSRQGLYIIKDMDRGNKYYTTYEDLNKLQFNIPKEEFFLHNKSLFLEVSSDN